MGEFIGELLGEVFGGLFELGGEGIKLLKKKRKNKKNKVQYKFSSANRDKEETINNKEAEIKLKTNEYLFDKYQHVKDVQNDNIQTDYENKENKESQGIEQNDVQCSLQDNEQDNRMVNDELKFDLHALRNATIYCEILDKPRAKNRRRCRRGATRSINMR